MNLKSRISRLRSQAGERPGNHQASPVVSDLGRRLAGIGPKRLGAMPMQGTTMTSEEALAKRLKGYRIAEGVIRIEQRLPLAGRLGKQPLARLRDSLRLPGEGREAHLRQVYVDTETTGLSGGSGTVAFLVGMAAVEADALVVTQYLLTRFAGEPAMLAAFARALTPDDRLVSYNGKSFDLPLLLTRYRMQGVPQPFEALPHLDLLHPIRRLFGKRWPDCRLLTLEERLLGLQRQDDLPGSEAPAAWTGYIQRGQADKLVQVVEHNRQDIVSLALAHAVLVDTVAHPLAYAADIASLARWLSDHDRERAYQLLKQTDTPLDQRGKRLLAQWARNADEWELALPLWEEMARQGCRHSAEQLAKYHEHVTGDLAVAMHYCAQMAPGNEQRRRLQRIENKQQRLDPQAMLNGFPESEMQPSPRS